MDLRALTDQDQIAYNQVVTHVIQSWQWGEFRKSLGLPLLRYGLFDKGKLVTAFQLTLHKIPFTSQYVGYLPKGPLPDKELAYALRQIGQDHHCAFIKVEPAIEKTNNPYQVYPEFLPSPKPLFTKFNFVLDLSKSEDELLKAMHPKTRYNLRLAQKKGVLVKERTDDQALETYLDLYFATTQRQGYQGHNRSYHRKVWKQMLEAKMGRFLIAYLDKTALTAWMLLNFKDTLYYPYGGSSDKHREVMASNLVAWEAIKLGKKLGCQQFDMWGALGPNANPANPHFGFHKFKQGYGGRLVEYVGTYDLVFNQALYYLFMLVDKMLPLKLFLLGLVGKR